MANTCLFVDTVWLQAWEDPCSTMGAGGGIKKYHAGDSVPFDPAFPEEAVFVYDPEKGVPAEFFDAAMREEVPDQAADEFFAPEPTVFDDRSPEEKILDWIEGAANFVLDHPVDILCYLIIAFSVVSAVGTILAPRRRHSSYEELQAEYYLDDEFDEEEGEGATGTPRTLPIAGKKQGVCDQCGKNASCSLDATGHLTCGDCLDPSSQLARV